MILNKEEIIKFCIPAVLMAGMLVSCHNEIEEINSLASPGETPLQVSYNATYDYSENGQLKNKMIASKLERFGGDDPRIVVSEGFRIMIYDSLGQLNAELTAIDGIFEPEKGLMTARNKVELVNVNGDQLNTEELIWDRDSAMVYTDKFVKIANEDGILYGEGLISDEKFENYELLNISGDIYVDEEQLNKENE